jgi:hypothetical protein
MALSLAQDMYMKMTTLWDTAPCSFVEVDRRFRGAYCVCINKTTTISQNSVIFIFAAVRICSLADYVTSSDMMIS